MASEEGGFGLLTLGPWRPPRPADRQRLEALLAYHRPGGFDREQLLKALAPATAGGDGLLEAHIRLALARGEPSERATEWFRGALQALPQETPPFFSGYLHLLLAGTEGQAGDFPQAREAFHESLQAFEAGGHASWQAEASNELGILEMRAGRVTRALPHYHRAAALWRQLGREKDAALVLHNLGKAYFELDQLEEALHHLEDALELRQGPGLERERASTLTALGGVLNRQRKREQALSTLHRALELRRVANDTRGRAVTLTALGVTYKASGRSDEALLAYGEALQLQKQAGNLREQALVLNDLGWLYESLGQGDEASQAFRRALEIFTSIADRRWETLVHCGLAFAERRRGHLDVALVEIEKALERVELLRLLPAGQRLRHTVFASHQDLYEFYVDLLVELHHRYPNEGYAEAAFQAGERARARALLDTVAAEPAAATSADGASSWGSKDEEEALRREIEGLDGNRRRLMAHSPESPELLQLEADLRTRLAALTALREHRLLEATGHEPPTPTDRGLVSLEEIHRDLLQRSDLLLAYKLGRQRSFLWLLDGAHPTSPPEIFELPSRSRLEEAARQAYALLETPGRRQTRTRQTLQHLSDTLLAPVAQQLAGRSLLIVADGSLSYIPFAALPSPIDPERPLLLDHTIGYLPSASVATALRRRAQQPAASGALALIADPVFRVEDPRLRGVAKVSPPGQEPSQIPRRLTFASHEAEVLRKAAKGKETFLALGLDANRETVLGGALARYRLVHFATHGELDSEHPELSRLVLSQLHPDGSPRPGYLYTPEIYDLELAADLVVLSACRTALGKEVRGEGLVGLTQAFLEAGADRVLVSLWSVEDRATAELMGELYEGLLHRGLPAPQALREAQLQIRRRPGFEAPFFWAGFVVLG